ncbi:MAG TPA: hypothetical protein VIU10_06945 [Candidatus Udaeobacter sp.]
MLRYFGASNPNKITSERIGVNQYQMIDTDLALSTISLETSKMMLSWCMTVEV